MKIEGCTCLRAYPVSIDALCSGRCSNICDGIWTSIYKEISVRKTFQEQAYSSAFLFPRSQIRCYSDECFHSYHIINTLAFFV